MSNTLTLTRTTEVFATWTSDVTPPAGTYILIVSTAPANSTHDGARDKRLLQHTGSVAITAGVPVSISEILKSSRFWDGTHKLYIYARVLPAGSLPIVGTTGVFPP